MSEVKERVSRQRGQERVGVRKATRKRACGCEKRDEGGEEEVVG